MADQQSGNVTAICTNPACTATKPVTSGQQLAIPAGAVGDFLGPGTTVGIPFAVQIGARVTFEDAIRPPSIAVPRFDTGCTHV